MTDRDWDKDFDLLAWEAQDPGWRKAWLDEAMIRERDEDDSYDVRRRRYERGQTAWDIGLDPLPFTLTLSNAVDEVKPEHWDGVVFGDRDVRHRVVSALLANAGLRRTLRLAPRDVWEQAIRARAAAVAWERAVAVDRARGTRTAVYEPEPTPTPVIRAEFVTGDEGNDWPFQLVRHEIAQPFYHWQFKDQTDDTTRTVRDERVLEIGYLVIGDNSMPRADLLVLHHPWNGHWPHAADAALVVHVANTRGALLFDWRVRRSVYLEAGAREFWVIDTLDRRILRQRRGQQPTEVRYREPGQIATWYDEADQAVTIELKDLFPDVPDPSTTADDQPTDFAAFNSAEVARLQRFDTPWTVGHTPQWFNVSISPLLGQFKDELWDGILFGPEYQRDALLSALLANVGLYEVLQLAPLELWEQALAEDVLGTCPATST